MEERFFRIFSARLADISTPEWFYFILRIFLIVLDQRSTEHAENGSEDSKADDTEGIKTFFHLLIMKGVSEIIFKTIFHKFMVRPCLRSLVRFFKIL